MNEEIERQMSGDIERFYCEPLPVDHWCVDVFVSSSHHRVHL